MVNPYQYYWQAKLLTVANMKARYRKTFAGFLWVIMSPLVMFMIQSLIFRSILRVQIENYHLFLLGGLLPWYFIFQTLDMCTPIFVNSSGILKSSSVHPVVLLSAQIFDNAINFSIVFSVVLLFSIIFGQAVSMWVLLLPIPLAFLFLGTFSMAWILSTLNVFYRDTRFLIGILLNLLFFVTPIFYPTALVPKIFRWTLYVNPVYYLINPIRTTVYQFEMRAFLLASLLSLGTALFTFILATIIWRRRRNELYLSL